MFLLYSIIYAVWETLTQTKCPTDGLSDAVTPLCTVPYLAVDSQILSFHLTFYSCFHLPPFPDIHMSYRPNILPTTVPNLSFNATPHYFETFHLLPQTSVRYSLNMLFHFLLTSLYPFTAVVLNSSIHTTLRNPTFYSNFLFELFISAHSPNFLVLFATYLVKSSRVSWTYSSFQRFISYRRGHFYSRT